MSRDWPKRLPGSLDGLERLAVALLFFARLLRWSLKARGGTMNSEMGFSLRTPPRSDGACLRDDPRGSYAIGAHLRAARSLVCE